MKLRHWATVAIVVFSLLLELAWVLVALEVGYIQEKEIFPLIPWLIGAILILFPIAIATAYISSTISSKKFSIHHFYHRINWIAFFSALIIFTMMAMKKVNISNKEESKESPLIIKKLESSSKNIFEKMEKGCIKSHSSADGLNNTQIFLYCQCIVKDAKENLTNKEIRLITQLLALEETSNSAFLENDTIAKIVIQCIIKIDSTN